MAALARRRTAVLTFTLPGVGADEDRPLDVQREYRFELRLDGRVVQSGAFCSPLGDESWRRALENLRRATSGALSSSSAVAKRESQPGGLGARQKWVEDAGRRLHDSLRELGGALADFLADRATPRRLVIQSERAELHRLPWEAMLDASWRMPAEDDLSVVRCPASFDEGVVVVGPTAVVRAVFGPGTEARTRPVFDRLAAQASRRSGAPRLEVALGEGPGLDGDVVSVEAHGDPETKEVEAGDTRPMATPAVARLKGRRMVLLWSCHSGYVAPGEPRDTVALRLARTNTWVLVFATPLRFEAAGALAEDVVGRAFAWSEAVDPETAVLRARLRRFREYRPACEWASMMLWLRAPLDVSALTLDGPRVLPGKGAAPAAELERLRSILAEHALPGRKVLARRCTLSGAITPAIAEDFRGIVVHLRADDPEDEFRAAREELDLKPRSAHRADAFLAVLDRVAQHPGSLLLWSGVGEDEIAALRLLDEAPRNVAVVVATARAIDVEPGFAVVPDRDDPDGGAQRARRGGEAGADPPTSSVDDRLATLEVSLERGQHEEAARIWREVCAAGGALTDAQALRLNAAGYWSLIRTEPAEDALRCARKVEQLDPFEGLLLLGNLAVREGRHELAARRYAEAAGRAGDDFARARVLLDQAWLPAEAGDRELAERLYARALALLEAATDRGGSTWAAALGRALRDYADLIARDPQRAVECNALLRRAVLVHALDGRLNQVGAALKTRAKLERTLGRCDRAERALLAAGTVLRRCGNRIGWLGCVVALADLALERGQPALAVALAGAALGVAPADRGRSERASLGFLRALGSWRLGDLGAAAQWAARTAPELGGGESARAHDLLDMLGSLGIEARGDPDRRGR